MIEKPVPGQADIFEVLEEQIDIEICTADGKPLWKGSVPRRSIKRSQNGLEFEIPLDVEGFARAD